MDASNEVVIKGRDIGFLLFLTMLNVMNFVDRQMLGSFAHWVVPELGLTHTQFALLTGLVFIFFYSVKSHSVDCGGSGVAEDVYWGRPVLDQPLLCLGARRRRLIG